MKYTIPKDFASFESRLARLGLSEIELLPAPLALDITFSGRSLWVSQEDADLIAKIYSVLFPRVAYDLENYITDHPTVTKDKSRAAWQNKICDTYALWSHIYHKRDVFVTEDAQFHKFSKKPLLLKLGASRIEKVLEATMLLRKPI